MGRFSTTVHIKNKFDRMRFVNMFSDIMKKRGFVPCSENEAAQSYLFDFGEGWVTLANEDYKDNPKKAYDDTREMASALKTSAFSVEVVDSDFALLKLCNSDGAKDEVVVGDGSGYGVDDMEGTRELWENLFANGKTWEQFSEVRLGEETFVEDSLCEAAGILGIDPYFICADFDEVLEKADGDRNITALYFKNAAAKAKAMSLNAAFIKVFGEGLEPLGFKKIKYPYPYFLRLVNDEVIHVITFSKWSGHPCIDGLYAPDYGQFDILCMIKTIYSFDLDFPKSHFERYSGAFLSKREIYGKEHIADFDEECWKAVCSYFPFKTGENKQILGSFKNAFDITKRHLIPALDSASDLKSFLDFEYKFGQTPFIHYEQGRYDCLNQGEGLLHIKTDTCDSYLERVERIKLNELDAYEKKIKNMFANDLEKQSHYLSIEDEKRKKFVSDCGERTAFAKKIFNDKEWCTKALEELERRKGVNMEILRNYGLEL